MRHDIDFFQKREEFQGPDWSWQRRLVTQGICAMGCLGWLEVDDAPGQFIHACRSAAGNALGLLHQAGQLVPDDFEPFE